MSAHEDLKRESEVKESSDRSFGVVFAAVFALIGLWPLLGGGGARWWALATAVAFAVVALAAPRLLRLPNALWQKLGRALNRVVSPLVIGLVFFTAVVPTGLMMRLFGKDPLRLRFDREATSYWIERRPPGPPGDTMPNQF